MKVKLRVFSYLREHLPPNANARGEMALDLPDGASLKDLFRALGLERRLGAKIFDEQVDHTFQVIVNQVAVHDYAHPLADGDEIAMFPPMAGG
jgi:molybdopterin converting factor small subunit